MKRHIFVISLIVTISLTLYANTLKNSFVYDDVHTIVNNALIKDISNLPMLFDKGEYFSRSGEASYRPAVTFTYFIDYALYELKPWGYHLTNILLHAANGVLLYIFLTLFFNRGIPSARFSLLNNPPLLITILFITHPILTEAVNAVSYREDLLAFLFYMATLTIYLLIRSHRKSPNDWQPATSLLYIFSCLLYSIALFSKEMALTLPFIIYCYELVYMDKSKRRSALTNYYNIGYIVIALAYAYLRFYYFQNPMAGGFYIPDIWERLITIPLLILSYIKLLLFPVSLSAEYMFLHVESVLSALFIISCFVIFYLLSIAFRINKEIVFGILFFIITSLPIYNIIPIANPLAERYMYLPSVGFFISMVSMVSIIYSIPLKSRIGSKVHRYAFSFLLIVLITYSFGAVTRNKVWRDDYSLWSDMARKMPKSSRAHFGLGNVYVNQGNLEDAIKQFQIALQLAPNNLNARVKLVITYYNLGVYYDDQGNFDKAIQQYQSALRLDPSVAEAHYNMGNIYMASGLKDKAKMEFETVLKIRPDYVPAQQAVELLKVK